MRHAKRATDFELIEEAVNRTRLELKEAKMPREPNIHDAFAIFAAKLAEVYNE